MCSSVLSKLGRLPGAWNYKLKGNKLLVCNLSLWGSYLFNHCLYVLLKKMLLIPQWALFSKGHLIIGHLQTFMLGGSYGVGTEVRGLNPPDNTNCFVFTCG